MTTPRRSARRLVRRWWPVALAVPLGAAAGAGYAVVSHPSYAASAYVLVVPQNPGEAAIATNFAQAYGRLAGQPQVLTVAAAETGHTRARLESLVHGTTSPDAPMIEITGTGTRPQEAAQTADAVARSLVSFANASSKDTDVRLVTLAPAAEPDRPTTPSAKLDVAVGGAAGLLVGALVMMTRRRVEAAAPTAAREAPESAETPAVAATPTAPRPRTEEPPAAERAEQTAQTAKAEKGTKAEKVGKPGAAEEPPAKEKAATGSGR
ncbi:capsular polysaccharide biosynthesis protein [Kitasatospora sp. MAA19]|uniref:Wzz/FepE/Etk N-terminal domain-containing protein n=1 Tax=Kitasatospora sp. MAA19 TaxID=3035090 RepID=UPI002474F664|nr:Wzz/FepE/Etk N-terminal domain-containing protein [Kitasatospora sp. MAA19]MDH6706190.1 capsular polysaccharide biosynthesis protein [Kitasatospora sp. MAA19]